MLVFPTDFSAAENFKIFSMVFSEGWMFCFFDEVFESVESTISILVFDGITLGLFQYCLEHEIY